MNPIAFPELHKITAFDGLEYICNLDTDRVVFSEPISGGLPPVQYNIKRSYKQDGATEVSYYLQPRTVTLVHRANGCSREEYFEHRARILNVARPNRGGDYLTYTFIQRDGTRRAIRGRLLTPAFSNENDPETWDAWSFQEQLQFSCDDPLWFDPTTVTAEGTAAVVLQLVFPITFPIYFGGANTWAITPTAYVGTYYVYPVFTITGPMSSFTIEHDQLGVSVGFFGQLQSGEILTLDLQNKTADSNLSGDRWTELSPNSDLVAFRVEPDPIVAGGVNTFTATSAGASNNSAFEISYNTRYIGI